MDYPLWPVTHKKQPKTAQRLNPYSNGLPSLTLSFNDWRDGKIICLNPYSNGLPSLTAHSQQQQVSPKSVLIPILMDYPLWQLPLVMLTQLLTRLNPYSNGLPSLTWPVRRLTITPMAVLIPILMDYPLWLYISQLDDPQHVTCSKMKVLTLFNSGFSSFCVI